MGRSYNSRVDGQPFSEQTIEAVWQKGQVVPGYPSLRRDICGALINRQDYGKITQYGWEVDHIDPVSNGGTDHIFNLQPLQWENNRFKSDKFPGKYCMVG